MRRNMDIVRHILLETEQAESYSLDSSRMTTEEWDSDEVSYNAEIMVEAGLLDASVSQTLGRRYPEVLIKRLTWEGHDLLDTIRDDTVWTKTKAKLGETVGTAALEVVKAVAVSITRTALGLPPG